MHDHSRLFEEDHEDLVASIRHKREVFYNQYSNITGELPPSKERALQLLQRISNKDISNLRKVTKPT